MVFCALAVPQELSDLTTLHSWVLIHLLHGHTFMYKANPFLQRKQLLICHYIRIDLLTEEVKPLVGYIELVHAGVVCD